ncbi:MAG: methylated-DNA--[protein]-cysteine S-methyltransferase [Gammaproteobacteria bacterium]|nr:methylated-DNA--[protein]-cysteine S-methyltransferase [Gammaproteobacteria bacterium]MCP5140343.1 methylated-DNA--[protein]-cysteine S-methyltransferase [Chromatiales bacterium]
MPLPRPDAGRPTQMQAIWRIIAAIPPGRVASYGQIAALAGLPRGARQTARALRHAPAELGLPWHRVIAVNGRIAIPVSSRGYRTQISRLRAEGIVVDAGRVNMRVYRWAPRLDELLWGPMPDLPERPLRD